MIPAPIPARTVSPRLRLVLALVAFLALAVPVFVITHAPPRPIARHIAMPRRIVPPSEVPEVDPVTFQDLAPEDARAWNAAVPFSTAPNPPAKPFRFPGSDADFARALDCLAVAEIYEAGDDAEGEEAVAQVVLNRLRHPAFPKTVCGVVFEGSERSTGCQFTFTCDGALDRWHPNPAAWERARYIARTALKGRVYKPVGYATHYHTDWVVPYWSASLDKVAAVETHLFFRWSGWWGTPPAFRRYVSGVEPAVAKLAALSEAHRGAAAELAEVTPAAEATPVADPALPGGVAGVAGDGESFLVTLDPHVAPEFYPVLAQKACGLRPHCKFMGWTSKALTPAALPLEARQIASMSFSYLRDREHGLDRTLWNCAQTRRPDPRDCMKQQVLIATPKAEPFRLEAAPGATPAGAAAVPELSGVRFRSAFPMPSPSPSATPARAVAGPPGR